MVSDNIFRQFHQGALPSLKALGQKKKKKVLNLWTVHTDCCAALWTLSGIGTVQEETAIPSTGWLNLERVPQREHSHLLGWEGVLASHQDFSSVLCSQDGKRGLLDVFFFFFLFFLHLTAVLCCGAFVIERWTVFLWFFFFFLDI